jgi:hypothetical protein
MQGQSGGQGKGREGHLLTSNLADPDEDPIADLPFARADDDDDIAGAAGQSKEEGMSRGQRRRDGIAWVSEPSQAYAKQIPSKQPAAILSVLKPISVSVLVRFLAAFQAKWQQTLFSLRVRTLIRILEVLNVNMNSSLQFYIRVV